MKLKVKEKEDETETRIMNRKLLRKRAKERNDEPVREGRRGIEEAGRLMKWSGEDGQRNTLSGHK